MGVSIETGGGIMQQATWQCVDQNATVDHEEDQRYTLNSDVDDCGCVGDAVSIES